MHDAYVRVYLHGTMQARTVRNNVARALARERAMYERSVDGSVIKHTAFVSGDRAIARHSHDSL